MNRKQHKILAFAVFIIGFNAIMLQVVLMRELIVIFFGNELSVGSILGIWLLWTAAGSAILSRLTARFRPLTLFPAVQITLALTSPFLLLLTRNSKNLLGLTTGEMTGFVPMLIISLLVLAIPCLLSGLLYSLSCRILYSAGGDAGKAVSRVYFLEAAGSCAGGIVSSFLLFEIFSSAQILMGLSAVQMICAISVILFAGKSVKPLSLGIFFLSSAACVLAVPLFSNSLESTSSLLLWKGHQLLSSRNTRYGNIAVTKMGEQISFFQNGLHVFSSPDPMTAEEAVHYTLLAHPDPKSVLLVGGGPGETLEEIDRHPSVTDIHYVELDPVMVILAIRFLPDMFPVSENVHIHYMDARRFIKTSQSLFDVIILNLPNPFTAQLNRFYTLEFFGEAKKKLSPGGIISVRLDASENMIGTETAEFLSSIYSTFSRVFPDPAIIPGETVRLIGSVTDGVQSDPDTLIVRLHRRNLGTRFVREYFLPFQMSKERIAYIENMLRPVPENRINRDFKPIGYYFDTILWATTFSSSFKNLFLLFSRLKTQTLALCIVLFTALVYLTVRIVFTRKGVEAGIYYSILSIGFTEISLEVILILGFQILFGYVYHQLALLIASYMAGLTIGSWMTGRSASKTSDRGRFILFQALMALYPLVLYAAFHLFGSAAPAAGVLLIKVLFPLLTLGAGFIGGYQFPLANRLLLDKGKPFSRIAGSLYGIDLAGSSIGALFTGAFLVSIFGIFSTLLLLAILNICSLGLLLSLPGDPSVRLYSSDPL